MTWEGGRPDKGGFIDPHMETLTEILTETLTETLSTELKMRGIGLRSRLWRCDPRTSIQFEDSVTRTRTGTMTNGMHTDGRMCHLNNTSADACMRSTRAYTMPSVVPITARSASLMLWVAQATAPVAWSLSWGSGWRRSETREARMPPATGASGEDRPAASESREAPPPGWDDRIALRASSDSFRTPVSRGGARCVFGS